MIVTVGQRISGITTFAYNDALDTQLWSADHGAQLNSVALDNDANVITGGNRTASLTTRKYSSSGGTPTWSIDHGGNVQGVVTDSTGNVYITGARVSSLTSRKYNSSGTEQWSVDAGINPSTAIAVDPSGNVYVGGNFLVKKYNSSGTFQSNITTVVFPTKIAVDSGGNVYVCGSRTSSITTEKYNSSGTQQWTADHGGTVNCITVDSDGNVYTGGDVISSVTTRKYNSSGTQQWSANHGATVRGICLDGAGNVYTAGTYVSTTPFENLRKYSNSGTLLTSLTLPDFPVMYAIAWGAASVSIAIPALALKIALGMPYPTAFVAIPALSLPIRLGLPTVTGRTALEYPPRAIRTIYRLILSGLTSQPVFYQLIGIQCRRRLGESTWMVAEVGVTSASMEVIIASYVGREMLIELGYGFSDGSEQWGDFLRSTITEYEATQTPRGLAITITGRVINPPYTATTRVLRGIGRIQTDDSRLTVHCAVDPLLRPNDTAVAGSESFTVDSISYQIDPERAEMIVTEIA